jgi:O-antigen/teichoic acid export membrane protein
MPDLVPVGPHFRAELRCAAFVGMASLLFSPISIFRVLLECLQLGSVVNLALMLGAVVVNVASVSFAWKGYGLPAQSLALVMGSIAFNAVVWWFERRTLGPLRSTRAGVVSREKLWSLRWPLTIAGVGNHLNLVSDYIVVGIVAKPADVTTFSITQRLINALGSLVTSTASAVWPGLTSLIASDGQAVFQSRVLELYRLIFGVSITTVMTVAAYNRHFVRLWVGQSYYGGDLLSFLTAAQIILFSHLLLFSWLVDVKGDTRDRVVMSSIGSVLNLGLSCLLGSRFGLVGVTLGTILGYAATDAWFGS